MVAKVLVIGAGVSGLTTALCLARAGHRVTVVADKVSPKVTSNVAGALWEWPPAVCGRHHDDSLLAASKTWAAISYGHFYRLALAPNLTGVYLRRANFYSPSLVEDNPSELRKMTELAERVLGFAHHPELIARNRVSSVAGMVDAYSFLAPMIDTDRYLGWLNREVKRAGCATVRGRLRGCLRDQERSVRRRFDVEIIVDCAGLGARELAADDSLSPHRGAVIRVDNGGATMPRITEAHCVAHDPATGDQNMIFILPRGEDTLLIGGIVEPDQWDVEIDFNYRPISEMLRRNVAFLPALASATVDPVEPVRVGLRPTRAESVAVGHEPGTRIVHNYGHGGSGVSLSWGCALDITRLVRQVLDGELPAPSHFNV